MSIEARRYTKQDRWTPRHYGDELFELGDDGRDPAVHLFDFQIDFTDRKACYRADVRCPGCDRRRPAFCVVDCRHLPDGITGGQSWACEACWSLWVGPDGGHPQRCSEAEWVALQGAPKPVVDHFRQVQARRKDRGWRVADRVPGVVDLDAVTPAADDPRELSWPEPTGRGAGS